jgi:O-antigen/teichoic acid export membrane protein
MSGRLGSAAVHGSLWLGLVNLVSKGSQMAVTLVLAVSLTEGDLGLVALAVSLVNVGQVIQSMGVYDVISRTEREPGRMAGTVLTMSVGVSIAIALVVILAAEPVAAVLGAPSATPLIRLAALSLPFSAAGGVQLGLLHRELDFRRRLLPDAGSAVLGASVTVVLALSGAGQYSLVIGLLCTAVAQPLLGIAAGVRILPCWDRRAAVEAARWIAVVGPAAVVANLLVNVDYPTVGHVLGPAAVGVYSLAYRIAWVPYIMVAIVLGAVAFPVYTRLIRTGRREELPTAVGRFTHGALVVTGGLYLISAVLSGRVVLLGERWGSAADVLVLLCAYGLGISLLQTWYQAIKAAGHARLYLTLEVSHLVALVAGLALLTRYGLTAVATAQVLAAWLLIPCAWWAMARIGVAPPRGELARTAVRTLLAGAACAVPTLLLDRAGFFGSPGSGAGAVAEGTVLVLGYLAATLLAHRGAIAELRALRPGHSPNHEVAGGHR